MCGSGEREARRRRFVTGAGPDGAASKSNALRPHMPEKSGIWAASFACETGATSTRKASKNFFIAALSFRVDSAQRKQNSVGLDRIFNSHPRRAVAIAKAREG